MAEAWNQKGYKQNQLKRNISNLTQIQSQKAQQKQVQTINNEKKQQKFLREDLFLIKVKISSSEFSKRIRDGQFKISSVESKPFQIPFSEYKRKFPKQLKPKFKFIRNIFQSKNEIYSSQKNKNKLIDKSPEKRNQQQANKIRLSHGKAKNALKIASNSINLTNNQYFNKGIIKKKDGGIRYQQNYQFGYLKELSIIQDIRTTSNLFKTQLSAYKQNSQTIFDEKQSNLSNIYIFTASKYGQMQMTFKEKDQKDQNYHLFMSKFPLKPFLQIPYTSHEISLGFFHKISNPIQKNNTEEQQATQLQVQIICASGDYFRWGKLCISRILIDNFRERDNKNQKKYVTIKLEFPDVKKHNVIRQDEEQESVGVKAISLQHDQNPQWDDSIEIEVNHRKNIMIVKFIEMEDDKIQQIRVIAQKTVNLLQDGFLFDQIVQKKYLTLIPVKSQNQKNVETINMRIQFMFEMTKNRFDAQQNELNKDYNSFVNANLVSF